jgi:UPF0755 protein
MKSKLTRVIVFSLLILGVALSSAYYVLFQASNLSGISSPEGWYLVKEACESAELPHSPHLTFQSALSWKIACALKRVKQIKPGRYRLEKGMSNSDIIAEFRKGGKSVVTVRIDDTETLEELASKLGASLLHDSAYFMNAFLDDSLLHSFSIDEEQLSSTIRPNTYEFYWNMDAGTFLSKMKEESEAVWNSERLKQADSIGLTAFETTVLASIVKAETGSREEAPVIAALYLNRLRIGMPLQSDPTTLFGRKKSAQRVYKSDLQAESVYNTYLHTGLPPGPINFPETSYIDAVLNAPVHRYLYMCAQPGGTGKHNFAVSFSEHEANRRSYIQWLEKSGIQ